MKNLAKIALGAVMLAGAATVATTAPAAAAVSVGIGLGAPAYYPPPAYGYSCDPYSRWYDGYRCGHYAPYPYYYDYGPSFSFGFRGGDRDFRGGFRGDTRGHR